MLGYSEGLLSCASRLQNGQVFILDVHLMYGAMGGGSGAERKTSSEATPIDMAPSSHRPLIFC